MESNEYKNGYNDCVEKILNMIQHELLASKCGDVSVNDELRLLRRKILDTAFHDLKKEDVAHGSDTTQRVSEARSSHIESRL